MAIDFGARTLLYFVFDQDSPDMWSAWGDKVWPLTSAELAAMPVGISTLTVTLDGSPITVPGIHRTVSGRHEWLIRPLPDPVVEMFNALPGPGGWTDPAARDTWANTLQVLLARGVTPDEAIVGYPALFNAARAEIL